MTTSTTTLSVTFVSESAAYDNTFGWYNSQTGMGGILFADVEDEGKHAPLTAGVSTVTFTVNTADLPYIQFFLVSDGYDLNKNDSDDLTGAVKVIQLSDGTWAVADVDSHGNVITDHGKPDILQGAGANALFTETSKNAGHVDYASSTVGSNQTAATLAGDTANGPTGTIAWEDLAATKDKHGNYGQPGDADYNDAVFQVSIVGGNHAPVANADTASVGEDAAATTINVLANDTDPDSGNTLHVASVATAGVLGVVTIAPGGTSITYTPAASFQSLAAGETAVESFTYTVADQSGATSSASVTVTVVGANDAPVVAQPVAGSGNEGSGNFNVNLLVGASDVDHGAVLHVGNLVWTDTGSGLPAGFTFSGNSISVDTNNLAYNGLAQGQTFVTHFSYDVIDEHGALAHQTAAITIIGTNDGPTASADTNAADAVVEAGVNPGNTPFAGDASAAGNVLANDSDPDLTDVITVSGVAAGVSGSALSGNVGTGVTGVYGSLTLGTNGAWSYSLNNADSDTNALAQGEVASDVFSYTIADGHGGFSTTTLTVKVTGSNDAPSITGGTASGTVTEDSATPATGHLTAFDPDHGAALTWSVVGAPTSGNTGYQFSMDSFTVTKGAGSGLTVVLQDDFSDGNPPPSSPPLNPNSATPSPTTYAGIGGFEEANGKLILDSNDAVSFVGVGNPNPVVGQDAVVKTNTDPNNLTLGLKSGSTFDVTGVFDLILPDNPGEGYGIRLTDRLVGGSGTPPDQPGDNVVELAVRESSTGVERVLLRNINFANDVTTNLGSITLNTSLGADQIQLHLTHSGTDGQTVHASFDYLLNGIVIGTQSFDSIGVTGTIFQGENWVRPEIVASAPAPFGIYGNLSIDQNGQWTYNLDNTRTATQNLAQGQQAIDTVSVQVADEFGATSTTTVTVTVVGTNDAPVMQTPSVSRALTEDAGVDGSGNLTASGLTQFSDVDLTDTHTVGAALQSSTLSGGGTLPAGLSTLLAGAMTTSLVDPSTGDGHGQIQWNFALADSATQFLAAGQTLTLDYHVTATDPFGASASQDVLITITGANDAPAAVAISADANEDSGNPVTLTASYTDADAADTHTFGLDTTGTLGTVVNNGDGTFSYDPNGQFEALALGETATDTFHYTVNDGHGGISTATATVTIHGENDAPTLSGPAAAQFTEDTLPLWSSGQLTASDPDHGATQTWSIVGGTTALQDYNFALDELKIVRNSALFFDDTFSDGVAPPSAPNFVGGNPTAYSTMGSFFESVGRLLLVGTNSVTLSGLINGLPSAGENATLQSDVNNSNTTAGLKKNMDFTVESRFDLTIPDDVRDQYGIRLTDSLSGQPGDNTVSLVVRDDANGVHVDLNEMNFVTGTSTVLQGINLTPAAGDDQIVLRLAHVANSTAITASFDLLDNGVVTSTQTFSLNGHAFDNENFVQAQIVANGAPETVSVLQGTYTTLTVDQSGEWTARLRDGQAAVQALAQGETATDTFNVQVTDDHGATATQPVTVTVTGVNDAPVITGGTTTGSITEDAPTNQVSGQINATDVDHGATQTWTVVGGTPSTGADYHFSMDSLQITKGSSIVLLDNFDDGNPPPSSPDFNAGQPNDTPTSYGGSGTFTESGGKLHFDSQNAVSFVGVGTNDPIIGQDAVVRTNVDSNTTGPGLKIGTQFTISGVFDLVMPDSPREAYGIRVTDRLTNPVTNADNSITPAQQGDNTYELVVREGLSGQDQVSLRHLDFATNVSTTLQNFILAPPVGADQILLKLDHAANSSVVTASFQYMLGGALIGTSQPFTMTAPIFAPGSTDTEVWTRAEAVAYAPQFTDSLLAGSYGTLDIGQSGSWNYILNNALATTQALAQGQTAIDTFHVQVADEYGATSTTAVTITVTGSNDAPMMLGAPGSATVTENGAPLSTSGFLQFSDADLTDSHTTSAILQSTTTSGGASVSGGLAAALQSALSSFVFDPATGDGHGQVQWNFNVADSDINYLNAGQSVTATYLVNVTDSSPSHATATQTVTVTIDGIDNDIYGTPLNDVLNGTPSDNNIYALAGQDIITGGLGNDHIDGGDDTDMAVFSGPMANYTITPFAGQVIVAGPDGTDTLTNVELLQFSDAYQMVANTADISQHDAFNVFTFPLAGFNPIYGTDGGDFLTVGTSVNFHPIDLGDGLDNLYLDDPGATNFYLDLHNVEQVYGLAAGTATLVSPVDGTYVDLGFGFNTLNLANGGNTVTVANTETINGGTGDDTVTLASSLTSGSSINLNAGNDVLNLTASEYDYMSLSGVEEVHGQVGVDEHIILGNVQGGTFFDLGYGTPSATPLTSSNNTLQLWDDFSSVNVVSVRNVDHVIGTNSPDQITILGNDGYQASGVTTVDGNWGADLFTLIGVQADVFHYSTLTDSSGSSVDTINGFDSNWDIIDARGLGLTHWQVDNVGGVDVFEAYVSAANFTNPDFEIALPNFAGGPMDHNVGHPNILI